MSDATTSVFAYALYPHERRHGPQGYEDYQSYKPWLRDEFSFRCVYCLCRESWFPDGDDSFSVDHFTPRTAVPERATDHDNLVKEATSPRHTEGVPCTLRRQYRRIRRE